MHQAFWSREGSCGVIRSTGRAGLANAKAAAPWRRRDLQSFYMLFRRLLPGFQVDDRGGTSRPDTSAQ